MPETPASSYDEIAGLYDTHWSGWYLPGARPALEKLFFSKVPKGARVLDVCCGSGHVTRELVRRGYKVTGIDSSKRLIRLAQQHLPGVDLRVEDARNLNLERQYDAAISTFDSLNHILSLEELRGVFASVHKSLERGGLFVFDMNLEEAYSTEIREWTVDVSDESVALVRGTYDVVTKRAATEVIWFVKACEDHLWKQRRTIVEQRCYLQSEILIGLTNAGFRTVEAMAASEAGVRTELANGRVFFIAHAYG